MASKVVEKFKEIRDIPYSIPVSTTEVSCNCVGKNSKLKTYLEDVGYTVRWRVGNFRWRELGVPSEIADLGDDVAMHAWLEFYADDQWYSLDATWDSGLSPVFDIAHWDGESSTKIGVPIIRKFSPDKSEEIVNTKSDEPSEKKKAFFRALNEWLEKVRRGEM